MSSKVLIIGGFGFLGSNIAESLLKSEKKVIILDKKINPFFNYNLQNLDYIITDNPEYELDKIDWEDIFQVFHLGGVTNPNSFKNLNHSIDSDLKFTINLLNHISSSKTIKLIYISSGGAIYSGKSNLWEEKELIKPISGYGLMKGLNEMIIQQKAQHLEIPYLIIRPSNPYGRRQVNFGKQGLIATVLHCLKNNKEIIIKGELENSKDYIYIDDFIYLLLSLVDNQNAEGIFNIGIGRSYSIYEILDTAKEITGKSVRFKNISKTNNDISNFVLNNQKVLSYTNNQSYKFKSLMEGMKEHWYWIIENNV